jgi:hypothetical protein
LLLLLLLLLQQKPFLSGPACGQSKVQVDIMPKHYLPVLQL